MRGEYGVPGHMMDMDEELPPRARRILNNVFENVLEVGTTSACAENTFGKKHAPEPFRNYLRVRGEYTARLCGVW